MDGGAWWAAVHEVARVGHDWATSLSLFTFMHWRRKWQPTPVFLPGESQGREAWWAAIYGSHRVGHDWSDLSAAAADLCWASLVVQLVKNLPARRETRVRSLGWEDPLEKGKATHSSILAYSLWRRKESDMTEQLSLSHICYTFFGMLSHFLISNSKGPKAWWGCNSLSMMLALSSWKLRF